MEPMAMGMTAASLLSGFLGGNEYELPPEMQRLVRRYIQLFREQRQYGKGVPLSDVQEQSALAQQKAMAGEGMGQQYEGLLASLGTNNPNAGDALSQFRSNTAGTMAGLDMHALLGSLGSRQQAKWGGAASMLGGAMGAAGSSRTNNGMGDLTGLLGQLGQQFGSRGYKPQSPFKFYQAPRDRILTGSYGVDYQNDMDGVPWDDGWDHGG